MNFFLQWRSILVCLGIILLMLLIISLFDIIILILNSRFYSDAAFITIFGVGGIFASIFAYMYALNYSSLKNEWARWSLIITIISSGLLCFFLISKIEGGEYEMAFKAYGSALALISLIFVYWKPEL